MPFLTVEKRAVSPREGLGRCLLAVVLAFGATAAATAVLYQVFLPQLCHLPVAWGAGAVAALFALGLTVRDLTASTPTPRPPAPPRPAVREPERPSPPPAGVPLVPDDRSYAWVAWLSLKLLLVFLRIFLN